MYETMKGFMGSHQLMEIKRNSRLTDEAIAITKEKIKELTKVA